MTARLVGSQTVLSLIVRRAVPLQAGPARVVQLYDEPAASRVEPDALAVADGSWPTMWMVSGLTFEFAATSIRGASQAWSAVIGMARPRRSTSADTLSQTCISPTALLTARHTSTSIVAPEPDAPGGLLGAAQSSSPRLGESPSQIRPWWRGT